MHVHVVNVTFLVTCQSWDREKENTGTVDACQNLGLYPIYFSHLKLKTTMESHVRIIIKTAGLGLAQNTCLKLEGSGRWEA